MSRRNTKEPRSPGTLVSAGQGSVSFHLLEAGFKRPLAGAAAIVGLFLAAVLALFFPLRYENLDDACMDAIVSGRIFSDAPDEHLPYLSVVLGLGLKGLYQSFPSGPWYGLCLFLCTGAALVGIVDALLRANPTARGLILTVAFLGAFALPCVVKLQFTRVAFLAALAGLLQIVTAYGGRPFREACVTVSLLTLASLIRFDACLLACAVLAPVVMTALWSKWRARPQTGLWLVLLLAGTLALGYGLSRLNYWYYGREQGWRDFYDFNALRAEFTDYSRFAPTDRTKQALKTVGWNTLDWAMLQCWHCTNEEQFSPAKLRTLLASASLADQLPRSWSELAGLLASDSTVLALLGVGAAGLVLLGGTWRCRIVPLLCLLLAVAICIGLFFRYYLPARVYFCALGGFLAATGVGSCRLIDKVELWPVTLGNAARALALLVILGLVGWRWVGYLHEHGKLQRREAQASEMMVALNPHPEQLYVLWGDAFPYEDLIQPLRAPRISRDFRALGLGWMTRTPLTARRYEQFAITDLFRAYYEVPAVRLIGHRVVVHGLLVPYLAKRYRVMVVPREVFRHSALGEYQCFELTNFTRGDSDQRAGLK
jgi:hypothetical protein